jgi:hypothetical protein
LLLNVLSPLLIRQKLKKHPSLGGFMRGDLRLGLIGAGLGAGLMFLLDPQLGKRRRALARDKALSWARRATIAIDRTSRDVRNRAYGAVVNVRSGHPMRNRPAVLNANWPPAVRFIVGATGGILTALGAARRDRLGILLGALGVGTAAVGITDFSVRNLIGRLSTSEGAGKLEQQRESVAQRYRANTKIRRVA